MLDQNNPDYVTLNYIYTKCWVRAQPCVCVWTYYSTKLWFDSALKSIEMHFYWLVFVKSNYTIYIIYELFFSNEVVNCYVYK